MNVTAVWDRLYWGGVVVTDGKKVAILGPERSRACFYLAFGDPTNVPPDAVTPDGDALWKAIDKYSRAPASHQITLSQALLWSGRRGKILREEHICFDNDGNGPFEVEETAEGELSIEAFGCAFNARYVRDILQAFCLQTEGNDAALEVALHQDKHVPIIVFRYGGTVACLAALNKSNETKPSGAPLKAEPIDAERAANGAIDEVV